MMGSVEETTVCPLLESIPQLADVLTVEAVVGEGTFSTVYRGAVLPDYCESPRSNLVAIKHISQVVEPSILANEIKCLTTLAGKHNVVELLFAVRHQDSLALIMPYMEHDKFTRIVKRFGVRDTRDYVVKLLTALRHLHSHNIIHRDVKPNNFLYNSRTGEAALVDFGLAQIGGKSAQDVVSESPDVSEKSAPLSDLTNGAMRTAASPGHQDPLKVEVRRPNVCGCGGVNRVCRVCLALPMISASRAGTAGYRPPEVLLKCADQTTAIDIWAVGIILLSILSGRANFFDAPDDLTNLAQLVALFGQAAMCNAASAMGKELICDLGLPLRFSPLKVVCEELRSRIKLKTQKRKTTSTTYPSSAYDLLEKLLALNPAHRITAADALKHEFLIER